MRGAFGCGLSDSEEEGRLNLAANCSISGSKLIPIDADVAGRKCGFTQDSQTVLRGRAVVETRFGLLEAIEASLARGLA